MSSREQISRRKFLKAAALSSGGAVILASLALSLGFALLGFSSFNITSVMGTLAALIIAIAALAELLLLPGLLILFDRGKL